MTCVGLPVEACSPNELTAPLAPAASPFVEASAWPKKEGKFLYRDVF